MKRIEIKMWKELLIAIIIAYSSTMMYGELQSGTGTITHPDGTIELRHVVFPRIDTEPVTVTQPDGKKIELTKRIYSSGYVQYGMQPGYTAIHDTLTGFWCYARLGEDGWLESTGYPLHLYEGREIGINRFVRPTKEKIDNYNKDEIINEPQSRAFEALHLKMPNMAPIDAPVKPLVIYISLNDQCPLVFNDVNNHFNGDGDSFSVRRYYRNMSNNKLNLEFTFISYRDEVDSLLYKKNILLKS